MSESAVVESLSERERTCLDHLRQAQELGVSYAEFCRGFDLNVVEWYPVRQGLVRKGLVAARGKAEEQEKPAGFAPVHVKPAVSGGPVCKIRHPSGWVIECGGFPDAQWLSALLSDSPR